VDVRKNSDLQELLEQIRRQGIAVEIRTHADLPTEELIRRVAEGTVGITVAHSHIALLNRRQYPEALAAAPIGEAHWLGWAVDPRAEELLAQINNFFSQVSQNGRFDEIYAKYYSGIHDFDYVDLRTFHRRIDNRLSRYSPFIKEAARSHGFDWRLIAAQIYQESHLHPWATSTAGAKGLMQLLPETAAGLGVTDLFNPVENINAGVRHLRHLYDQFEDIEGEDRILVALAAYNTGIGHVQDARSLAAGRGLDPDSWESLAETLPLLKYPRYYEKAKHGYCRGDEPVAYIKQIKIYYDILKRRGIAYGTGG
jgi:membrane-bound lytic murein transglycosylase F